MTRSSPRSKRRTRLMGSGTWLTIYNSRPALRRRDVWNAGRPQGRQKTMATQERGLRWTVNPDRLYEPETSGSTRPWKRHFPRATHWRIRWSPAFAQPLNRTTDSKLRDSCGRQGQQIADSSPRGRLARQTRSAREEQDPERLAEQKSSKDVYVPAPICSSGTPAFAKQTVAARIERVSPTKVSVEAI